MIDARLHPFTGAVSIVGTAPFLRLATVCPPWFETDGSSCLNLMPGEILACTTEPLVCPFVRFDVIRMTCANKWRKHATLENNSPRAKETNSTSSGSTCAGRLVLGTRGDYFVAIRWWAQGPLAILTKGGTGYCRRRT